MRYYDSKNNRLIYLEQAATPEYWDKQWTDESLKRNILLGAYDRFVYPITKSYLPQGSKILEGGCGKGQFVYSLQTRGYKAVGIDFAKETIEKIKTAIPSLPIIYGDVRDLPFEDNSFDGYWSLGVIEHFYDGYESIAKEMHRVLRLGGYLFITFPHMSKLRRYKSRKNSYPLFSNEIKTQENFYQFALSEETVICHFEGIGFKLVKRKPYEGFKGLKDELSGKPKEILTALYKNKSLFAQIITYIFARILAPLSSHSILLVFRKDA